MKDVNVKAAILFVRNVSGHILKAEIVLPVQCLKGLGSVKNM